MRDVALLLKFRLAFTVVFSAVAGYLLGAPEVDAFHLITLTIGGFAIVGVQQAGNGPSRSGLARTVGAEQRDNLAVRHFD